MKRLILAIFLLLPVFSQAQVLNSAVFFKDNATSDPTCAANRSAIWSDGTNFQARHGAGSVFNFLSTANGFSTPTVTVDGAVKVGTATTGMRSDGAPALANPFTPTTTQVFNNGVTSTGTVTAQALVLATTGFQSTGAGVAGSIAGNARGTGATDLQAFRILATQVGSGDYSTVGGGRSNKATHTTSTVGGGTGNFAGNNSATVGGGDGNQATGDSSTVGGGCSNGASNAHATVAGGDANTASGDKSTCTGGSQNEAAASYSAVGGGQQNSVTGSKGAIGGGGGNTVTALFGTVPGGALCNVTGAYGLSAGYDCDATTNALALCNRAKANHTGSMILADSTAADYASTQNDEFRVRATNGAYFSAAVAAGSTLTATTLVYATTGFQSTGAGLNAVTGNARGTGATDLQVYRAAATQVASGTYSVGCGGKSNTPSGTRSFVGSGEANVASGDSASVLGGTNQTASGYKAACLAGDSNTASGNYATASGSACTAQGNTSVALGNRAKTGALAGVFIFGDSTAADYTAAVADSFNARVAGGAFFDAPKVQLNYTAETWIYRAAVAAGKETPEWVDGVTYLRCSADGKRIYFVIPGEAGTILTQVSVKYQGNDATDGVKLRILKRDESGTTTAWTVVGTQQTFTGASVAVATYDVADETFVANTSYTLEIESEVAVASADLYAVGFKYSKRVF